MASPVRPGTPPQTPPPSGKHPSDDEEPFTAEKANYVFLNLIDKCQDEMAKSTECFSQSSESHQKATDAMDRAVVCIRDLRAQLSNVTFWRNVAIAVAAFAVTCLLIIGIISLVALL